MKTLNLFFDSLFFLSSAAWAACIDGCIFWICIGIKVLIHSKEKKKKNNCLLSVYLLILVGVFTFECKLTTQAEKEMVWGWCTCMVNWTRIVSCIRHMYTKFDLGRSLMSIYLCYWTKSEKSYRLSKIHWQECIISFFYEKNIYDIYIYIYK